MARKPMIIEKTQSWGTVRYDIYNHRFSYIEKKQRAGEPYAAKPLVLNIVITRKCNMDCRYCVAKDFAGIEDKDLALSTKMINWINKSPFMLLVLTGGEPLMPPYNAASMRLIHSIRDRGVMLDTNGTFLPDPSMLSLLKNKRVMVRVSMDSIRPDDEIGMRRTLKGRGQENREAYFIKLANIGRFISAGITTAIQTVVWQNNSKPLYQMIEWLSENGIKRWYLQRLIPSYKYKKPSYRFALKPEDYYPLVTDVAAKARREGVECVPKMDLRHNSVFLLMADGAVYTQGAAPGQKVWLGTIDGDIQYFDYVSEADHACRYYLADAAQDRDKQA